MSEGSTPRQVSARRYLCVTALQCTQGPLSLTYNWVWRCSSESNLAITSHMTKVNKAKLTIECFRRMCLIERVLYISLSTSSWTMSEAGYFGLGSAETLCASLSQVQAACTAHHTENSKPNDVLRKECIAGLFCCSTIFLDCQITLCKGSKA